MLALVWHAPVVSRSVRYSFVSTTVALLPSIHQDRVLFRIRLGHPVPQPGPSDDRTSPAVSLPAHPAGTHPIKAALQDWPGMSIATDPHDYATPAEVSGQTSVHVGRLRHDPNRDDALLCWVVADNLLKGAAWNAIQIADLFVAVPHCGE